jgi:hypothetical protein
MGHDYHETVLEGHKAVLLRQWYKEIRCSICTNRIWLRPINVQEPLEAPEPRQEWVLCKPCHEELQLTLRKSSLRHAMRLRIAMGLVAAERSPHHSPKIRAEQELQRDFSWLMRFLFLFVVLHLVVFVIVLTIPR